MTVFTVSVHFLNVLIQFYFPEVLCSNCGSYWKFRAWAFVLLFVFWKPTRWAHEWPPFGSAKLTLENWTPEDGVSLTTKALASRRNVSKKVEKASKERKELGNSSEDPRWPEMTQVAVILFVSHLELLPRGWGQATSGPAQECRHSATMSGFVL